MLGNIFKTGSDNDRLPQAHHTEKTTKIATGTDLLNILPARLRMEYPKADSAQFIQACFDFVKDTELADDSLQETILTYLLAITASQDDQENMTLYAIYQAIDNTLKLDKETVEIASVAGIGPVEIAERGIPEYIDIAMCPAKKYLLNLQAKIKTYTRLSQIRALSHIGLRLYPFCLSHIYMGHVGDEPMFDAEIYLNTEIELAKEKERLERMQKSARTGQHIDAIKTIHQINKETEDEEHGKVRKVPVEWLMHDYKEPDEAVHAESHRQNTSRHTGRVLSENPGRKKKEETNPGFLSCSVTCKNGKCLFEPLRAASKDGNAFYVNYHEPKKIASYLNSHVLGQKDAKKAASIAYYLHSDRHMRQNMIFIGPSGCGKTEIFRQLKEIKDHKIYIFDASSISNDGWRGQKKYYTVFMQMLSEGWTQEEIEEAIIVLDEADKMFAPKFSSGGDNVALSVQNEFLSMIEGTTIMVKDDDGNNVNIDTKDISFIFLGAFSELRREQKQKAKAGIGFGSTAGEVTKLAFADLIKFGLSPELAGRISRMVHLDALTEDDFYTILLDPQMSPAAKFAMKYGEPVEISTKYLQKLAHEAGDAELGVRYMHGRITDLLSEEIYEPGSTNDARIGQIIEDREEKYAGMDAPAAWLFC